MTSSHSTHSHEKHMRITWTLNSIVQTWNLLEVLLSKLLDFELSIVWTKNLLEVLLLKIVCWTTKQYNLLYYKFCILIISIVWWYNLLYYKFGILISSIVSIVWWCNQTILMVQSIVKGKFPQLSINTSSQFREIRREKLWRQTHLKRDIEIKTSVLHLSF